MSTQVATIWLSAKNNQTYFVIPIPPINYYGRPMQYKFKQWEHCCRTIGSRLSGELQADQKDIIKENLMRLALVYSLIKMLLGGVRHHLALLDIIHGLIAWWNLSLFSFQPMDNVQSGVASAAGAVQMMSESSLEVNESGAIARCDQ